MNTRSKVGLAAVLIYSLALTLIVNAERDRTNRALSLLTRYTDVAERALIMCSVSDARLLGYVNEAPSEWVAP